MEVKRNLSLCGGVPLQLSFFLTELQKGIPGFQVLVVWFYLWIDYLLSGSVGGLALCPTIRQKITVC